MKAPLPAAAPPRPRLELFSDTLSGRVLWLTVAIVMAVQSAVLVPILGQERHNWLWERTAYAESAAHAAAQTGTISQPAQDQILALEGMHQISLTSPTEQTITLNASLPYPPPDQEIDLTNETLVANTTHAVLRALGLEPDEVEVTAPSPLQQGETVDVSLNSAALTTALQDAAKRLFVIAAIVSLVTGLLVYAVLDRLLVRPLQIITTSINGFRRDPSKEAESDLSWLASSEAGDVAGAARELKIMQDEMRTALWRNARLAAVGTSVAKISHDLRNILSSALLVADRLQAVQDPMVQRATRRLIPAVERAAELVSSTVDFAREGPPAITRTAVRLHDLIDEATTVACPEDSAAKIQNNVPTNLVLSLDHGQVYRALLNLLRNAAEAGAEAIAISSDTQGGITRLRIADNGPGLPLRVQDNLFKPFISSGKYGGTGLGLAIARDLVRAHGGELTLEQTSPRGTVFLMDLPINEAQGLNTL